MSNVDRFGQIFVRAKLDGSHRITNLSFSGNHDRLDRQAPIPHLLEYRQAVFARQPEIKEHYFGRVRNCQVESFCAVFRRRNLEAPRRDQLAPRFPRGRIIFNNEYSSRHHAGLLHVGLWTLWTPETFSRDQMRNVRAPLREQHHHAVNRHARRRVPARIGQIFKGSVEKNTCFTLQSCKKAVSCETSSTGLSVATRANAKVSPADARRTSSEVWAEQLPDEAADPGRAKDRDAVALKCEKVKGRVLVVSDE